MKPIFQTIHGTEKGNCLQACVASLLELELEEVPHFILSDNWLDDMKEFLHEKGYEYEGALFNTFDLGEASHQKADKYINDLDYLKTYEGVQSHFIAGVYSPKHADWSRLDDPDYNVPQHAVIIDHKFNIVHDPNHMYQEVKRYPLAHRLRYNGVVDVFIINKLKEE